MILRTKLLIGAAVVVAVSVGLGVGLGVGLNQQSSTTSDSQEQNYITAVNTARDLLDVPVEKTTVDGKEETVYHPLFGSQGISYNAKEKAYVINLRRLFDESTDYRGLGFAFNVVVAQQVAKETGTFEYDQTNMITVPAEAVETFKKNNPEAKEVAGGDNALGLKYFTLPALDAAGQKIPAFNYTTEYVQFDPVTGKQSAFSSSDVVSAVRILMAKITRIADLTGVNVIFSGMTAKDAVNPAPDFVALRSVATSLPTATGAAQETETQLVTLGKAFGAFTALFGASGQKTLSREALRTTYVATKQEYDALAAPEQAKYQIFDAEGKVTIVAEDGETEVITRPKSEYAFKREISKVTVDNALLMDDDAKLKAVTAALNQDFEKQLRETVVKHESDSALFTSQDSAAIYATKGRRYKVWVTAKPTNPLATQATSEKKTIAEVVRANRIKAGFTYFGNYGFYPLKLASDNGSIRTEIKDSEGGPNGTVASLNPNLALSEILLRAFAKAEDHAIFSSIYRQLQMNSLFSTLALDFTPINTIELSRTDATKPVVFGLGSNYDFGLYLKVVGNYTDGEKALTKSYTKGDYKVALFGNDPATDADLLRFLLLEAKLLDGGYRASADATATTPTKGDIRIALPIKPEVANELLSGIPSTEASPAYKLDNGFIIIHHDAEAILEILLKQSTFTVYGLNYPEVETTTAITNELTFSDADWTAAKDAAKTDYELVQGFINYTASAEPTEPTAVNPPAGQTFSAPSAELQGYLNTLLKEFLKVTTPITATVATKANEVWPTQPAPAAVSEILNLTINARRILFSPTNNGNVSLIGLLATALDFEVGRFNTTYEFSPRANFRYNAKSAASGIVGNGANTINDYATSEDLAASPWAGWINVARLLAIMDGLSMEARIYFENLSWEEPDDAGVVTIKTKSIAELFGEENYVAGTDYTGAGVNRKIVPVISLKKGRYVEALKAHAKAIYVASDYEVFAKLVDEEVAKVAARAQALLATR